MKIAVLADIHGNHAALEAVLAEARRLKVTELFVLGDLVGYYYRPDKVLELLEAWPKEMIRGNHERMLGEAMADGSVAEALRLKYGSGLKAAMERLPLEARKTLTGLPSRKSVVRDGVKFELCHGCPWDEDFYVYPDADVKTLDRCRVEGSDFVLMGHTHRPFSRYASGVVLANAGSVGQARDRGGAASWLTVETASRVVTFQRTPYDATALIAETKAVDPHLPYLHEVLTRVQ